MFRWVLGLILMFISNNCGLNYWCVIYFIGLGFWFGVLGLGLSLGLYKFGKEILENGI